MNNIMIDFETLGTKPDCVVVSIGAVFFDLKELKTGERFYRNIDIETQLSQYHRTIERTTLEWWMKQGQAAKSVFSVESQSIEIVMGDFVEFCKAADSSKTLFPWGNGATFDIAIAENLMHQLRYQVPWAYWNVMDLRTFRRFVANDEKIKNNGTSHNALDDAIAQAQFVINTLRDKRK